jgi:hypothetical protein
VIEAGKATKSKVKKRAKTKDKADSYETESKADNEEGG